MDEDRANAAEAGRQTPDAQGRGGHWEPAPWQPQAWQGPGEWIPAHDSRGDPSSDTFGVGPHANPGRVPWTWRDVLYALLIAAAPLVALSILSSLVPGSSAGSTKTAATTGFALFSIILTLIVDGWFVLWAWFFSLRKYHLSWRSFGFRGYEQGRYWGIALAVILGGLVAVYVLSGVNDYVYRRIVGPVPEQNVVSIFPHATGGLVLFVLLAVVIAPILEETVFRGFIFQGLARSWGPLAGAVVSALIFALSHQQLSVLVPIFALGALLSAAFYWTRSIYTNMAFHAVFNALGVIAWWFLK